MPLRPSVRLAAALLFSASACPLVAQETPAPPKDETSQQLAALREAVIQQTRQIDVLTGEVARINQVLRGKRGSSEATTAAPIASPSPLPATDASAATATAPGTAATTGTTALAPAAASGPEHIVAKGETLAVIAKRYNTTVEILEKLNNITDPKKLQVDQVLRLPSAAPVATP